MARYLLIRKSDGVVTNAVAWDGNLSTWQPAVGYEAVLDDAGVGQTGDIWNGRVFIKPTVVNAPESRLDALIDILKSKAGQLSDSDKARLDNAEG